MPNSSNSVHVPSHEWSVLFELDAAGSLLATGARLIQEATGLDSIRDPVLTVWSIGAEKLMKVSLGLRATEQGEQWPNFKYDYGHGLIDLHKRLHADLLQWAISEGKGYVAGLLSRVAADPVWPKILDTLDCYAREGRFYRLDELSGIREGRNPKQSARWDDPRSLWSEIEPATIESSTELTQLQAKAMASLQDQELWKAFLGQVHTNMVDPLILWWYAIARAGQHGAFGNAYKGHYIDVAPNGVVHHVESVVFSL